MKQITLNIPSSSIDLELYQYDGLYRENLLISKELDLDIVQNITFENDAPVNFKIKTTPYLTYESFLPETEHNLFSILQVNTIDKGSESTIIYPKNDKVFVIKKVTSPQIDISTFTLKPQGEDTNLKYFFNIATTDLGYDTNDNSLIPVKISSNLGNPKSNYGFDGAYDYIILSTFVPLFFAFTTGGVTFPSLLEINISSKAYLMPLDLYITYTAKDNTKLDGTYENITLTPPSDLIGTSNLKLVHVPLFLTDSTINDVFKTDDLHSLFYVSNFPVYSHESNTINKTAFELKNGKFCSGYYPLSQENNGVRLAFFDKIYNTKTDKSASFYDIDLENSTFGILMPTESKMLSVKVSTHTTEHAQTYDMPLDIITGALFNKWPSEKNGKPSHVIFLPDIKVKPKTATVNVKAEFNFADAEMNSEAKEGIKNALILNMIDGEWNLATPEKAFEGIIADPIA